MKKKIGKASRLVTSTLLMLSLAACGGSDMKDSPYVGVWTATTAEMSGISLSVDTVLGGDMTLTLDPNGKATLTIAGDSQTGKWKETDDGFSVDDDFTMYVDGNTGYMDYDGVRLNFESDTAGTNTTETTEPEQETTEPVEKEETGTDKTTEEPVAAESGRVETDTFSVEVPEGWIVKRQTEDSIHLVRAASEDAYSQFSDPSFQFSVTEYAFGSESDSNALDKIVENDYQFFENQEPTVKEASADPYQGYLLTGNSASFKDCVYDYYDMDSWAEGTNLRSRATVRLAYFNDEDKKELEDIMDTIDITVQPPEASETADSGSVIETDDYTFVVPEGWAIESESAAATKLTSDKFPGAKVSIEIAYSEPQTWAESKSANFGGEAEVWTREYNGQTWTGITPTDSMEMMGLSSSDGITVIVSCMRVNLDQIPEIIEGVTVK